MAALAQSNTSPPPLEPSFHPDSGGWHELDYRSTISRFPGLSRSEKNSLTNVMADQLRPFMRELEISSDLELMRIAGKIRIEFVDLNGDGEPELIAQAFGIKGGCGATGNCPLWVFEKVNGHYQLILDTRNGQAEGGIQILTIRSQRTNGFNNLVLGTTDSASERTLYEYRFGKGRYHVVGCHEVDWWCWRCKPPRLLREPVMNNCR